MQTVLKLVMVLLLPLLTTGSILAAEISIDSLDQPVSIEGQWKFKTGDDFSWALTDYDDSQWEEVTVPVFASDGHSGYSGMAGRSMSDVGSIFAAGSSGR